MAANGSDDELVSQLRRIGSLVDPVPHDVVMAGRSALAYRDLDARIAELVDESTRATEAATRSDPEGPWFTFEVDDVVIEIAARTRAGEQHLVGHVDGSPVSRVMVRQTGSDANPDVDGLGRFTTPISAGPVRIVVLLGDGTRIATSWIIVPRA